MAKVIFINRYFHPDHSATSQLLTDLAFHLSTQGVDVQIITSCQIYDDPSATLPVNEDLDGVRIRRVWTSHFGRHRLLGRALDYLTFYLSAAIFLLRVTKRGDLIVAKTDPPLISCVAAIVAKLRRAVLVNWLQDMFPEVALILGMRSIGTLGPLLKTLRNFSLQTAQTNIVLSDGMARRVIAEGIKSDRITVVHNWADGDSINPIPRERNPLRANWGLEGRFVVGYSGNMGRAHEFQTILDAALLLAAHEEIVFLFIGDGAQRKWLEVEARKRRLENLLFKPYQPRNKLTLSLCVPDIHVISLRPELEGLIVPSKFYGACAAGRPMLYIGDKNGDLPQILVSENCGFAATPGDASAAAEYIRRISLDSSSLSKSGANARALFESRFDKSRAFLAWHGVLHRVGINVPVVA